MYVPADEEDYLIQTGKLPKALAANSAHADLKVYVFLKDRMVLIWMHKAMQ